MKAIKELSLKVFLSGNEGKFETEIRSVSEQTYWVLFRFRNAFVKIMAIVLSKNIYSILKKKNIYYHNFGKLFSKNWNYTIYH